MKARRPATRTNKITGKPRKWICYHHPVADWLLTAAEALAAHPRKKSMRNYYDALPLEVGSEVAKHLEQIAAGIRRVMEHKGALTEAELRYCELEGIDQADFLKAKSKAGLAE